MSQNILKRNFRVKKTIKIKIKIKTLSDFFDSKYFYNSRTFLWRKNYNLHVSKSQFFKNMMHKLFFCKCFKNKVASTVLLKLYEFTTNKQSAKLVREGEIIFCLMRIRRKNIAYSLKDQNNLFLVSQSSSIQSANVFWN